MPDELAKQIEETKIQLSQMTSLVELDFYKNQKMEVVPREWKIQIKEKVKLLYQEGFNHGYLLICHHSTAARFVFIIVLCTSWVSMARTLGSAHSFITMTLISRCDITL